jgi:glycosyltransferase involved in cell wall biosynthesis
MKSVLFIKSSEFFREPRAEKEVSLLINNYKVKVLCWDRDGKSQKFEKRPNYEIYRCHIKGMHGGGLKNLFSLSLWWSYCFFWLLKEPFSLVHACDFDSYLPSVFAAKIKRKKVIYDMFDFYGDMIKLPIFLKNVVKKLDLFLIQFADGLILTDEIRINQIAGSKPKKWIAIYNTPPDFYGKFKKNAGNNNDSKFTFGFIGLIEADKCDILFDLVSEIPGTDLILGGFSISESDERLRKRFGNIPNVKFLGRVYPYEKALEVLSGCDVMFVLYNSIVATDKYASSNKIFEAMMLGKPIIATRGTSADKVVANHKTGFVVDFNNKEQFKDAICELMRLKKEKNNFYGDNARSAYLNFFNIEIMKNRMLKFYEEILSEI